MSSPATLPADLRQRLESVGFAVLPDVFEPSDLKDMRRIIEDEHTANGAPTLTDWGYGCHPLLERLPAFEPYFHHPLLVSAFETILGGPVRLTHSGARLSSHESQPYIAWHHHYAWSDESVIATRRRCERILLNVYVDGSDRDIGPLVVLPRRLNESLKRPCAHDQAAWPGQQEVVLSPGSAVVFDTALWHTAMAGAKPGKRLLWGGHLMPFDDMRSHREDNGPRDLQLRQLIPLQGARL